MTLKKDANGVFRADVTAVATAKEKASNRQLLSRAVRIAVRCLVTETRLSCVVGLGG